MRAIVKKMSKLGILKLEMIIGALVMAAALIILPVGVMSVDVSLILNPYVLGVVLIGMLMFGSIAYFLFMRPYFIYRKSPEVLAETDGEFLYIHGKKEAKIPLSDLDGASVFVHLPFFYSNEFLAVLLIHIFSEQYGDISLDVPGYGSYKMKFVANADKTARELRLFIIDAMNVEDVKKSDF